MNPACALLHMQIKELEDALASARQSSAPLQAQLDAASASTQSQATDLTSAQAQVSQLRGESESLQSQLSEAQHDRQAAKEACQTQEAATANQAQQWTAKVNAVVCSMSGGLCELVCPTIAASSSCNCLLQGGSGQLGLHRAPCSV